MGCGRNKIIRRTLALALAGAGALASPAAAGDAGTPAAVPGEVVVGLADGGERLVELPEGVGVADAIERLGNDPDVAYATPNWIATAALDPNDPGLSGIPGGWDLDQWNLLPVDEAAPSYGIGANLAWDALIDAGRPGGQGVTVAVVDTGIAYRSKGHRFRRVPDINGRRFVRGRDFVDGDSVPLDEHGHGTHVAGTIGQQTGNGRFVTGVAYGSRLMPVRALGSKAMGTAFDVARGIRFAARNDADVINLSLTFQTCPGERCVDSCEDIAGVCKAIKRAVARGAVVVAAAGNAGGDVAFPGRIGKGGVIAVGATTRNGSPAQYSARGRGLELVAPGGGAAGTGCATAPPVDSILQVSFAGASRKEFCLQERVGTSMAAAHVAGAAALVIASGIVGSEPGPRAVEKQLRCSAHDLGEYGFDLEFGAGLLDAAAAVSESCVG